MTAKFFDGYLEYKEQYREHNCKISLDREV